MKELLYYIKSLFSFKWLYNLVELFVEKVLRLSMETRLGESIHFFIYDIIKIAILLSIMIFIISYIRSYFSPEKTKSILSKYSKVTGNIMASLLGIVTPFCSCSSVPLFIGFVESGIPLGVTFSFLITSPIVNEAAFSLLIISPAFGMKIALIYVVTGVLIGVLSGIIIDYMHLENEVEEYVYQMQVADVAVQERDSKERFRFAIQNVKDIIHRVWIYLVIGIGIGAIIHGAVPAELLIKYAGPDNPFAVIIGVVLGIPLYSNAMGTIPIAEVLLTKGVGIGTVLSFMMAVTALSLPELILLRKVIKPKLIAVFVVLTGISIIIVGYLFNAISHLLM